LENKRQNKRTVKRTILKRVSLAAIITALAPMWNAHLLEVGPAGYDTWQITGDAAAQRAQPATKPMPWAASSVLTYLPWLLSVNLTASMSILPRLVSKAGRSGLALPRNSEPEQQTKSI
jgi:hypothetical protein